MLKIKKAGVGFYFLVVSFIFGLLGFIYYLITFSIFRYSDDRLSIAMTVISLWLIGFLIVDTLFSGENPKFSWVFYALAIFMLTYSLLRLLTPCISPIAIHMTVGNMGDVKTNKVAVPKALLATVFYVISIVTLLVGGIFGTTRKERKPKDEDAQILDDLDDLSDFPPQDGEEVR